MDAAAYGCGKVYPMFSLDSESRYPNETEKIQIALVSDFFKSKGYTIVDKRKDADFVVWWDGEVKPCGDVSYTVTGDYISANRSIGHRMEVYFCTSDKKLLWRGRAVWASGRVCKDLMTTELLAAALDNFPNAKG